MVKTLTRRHCSKIGTAAKDHKKRARWTQRSIDACLEAANYLLGVRPGVGVDGLKSGTPPEEILLSSDYIEIAIHPEVALG